MRKLLVCQHVGWEILGTLDPLLRRSGYRIRYVNFARHPHAQPRLRGYDGLVLLGGPMNVDQVDEHPHLATEMELVEAAIEKKIPVLGVCLGAQLVARTLGAEIRKNPVKEIGWYDVTPTAEGEADPLIGHFEGTERIFQWHGDTFDIPPGADHLAASPDCRNQAFRYGDRVYGFQFHLEVDQPTIERWLTVPGNAAEIEELGGRIDPDAIRAETPLRIDRLHQLSDRVFRRFFHAFGRPSRSVLLPSR